MQVIEEFGRLMEKLSDSNPDAARWLLKTGWRAQNVRLKFFPDKRLTPADQYLSRLMMDTMLKPLRDPKNSAIVSIFTPCELVHEAGLHPYNVEGFSCYLSGSQAEHGFLHQAESSGISETLCSYHRAFLGAAEKGVLPEPKCIVYTNLACDANMLTFRRLAGMFQAPSFFIDVPLEQKEDNVLYVADQLRRLAVFLKEHIGRTIDEDRLTERLGCTQRTLANYREFQQVRAVKYVPVDLATPMNCIMTNNILLGTAEEEAYTKMLLRDVRQAQPTRGKRLYWMHTIPFWSQAVQRRLQLNEDAQIVGCDLAQAFDMEFEARKPYEAMARRMVYHALNGSGNRRIEMGIRHAKQAGAHGVVWFNHWGCKRTLGSSQLAKKKFEEEGIPLLLLDSDGCDRSHGGEGQLATRLGAFLEMLGGDENA